MTFANVQINLNDIDTDDKHKNIILSYGIDKSLQLYNDAESNFIELLNKYNLLTPTFQDLVKRLKSKLKL